MPIINIIKLLKNVIRSSKKNEDVRTDKPDIKNAIAIALFKIGFGVIFLVFIVQIYVIYCFCNNMFK